ncbi:MAG: helix-turn-helix transcriptional regulator [Rhodanobacteraceae bacterium]
MNAITRLKKAGLSRADIARACGVTRHAVGFWESGRSVPQGANYSRLCDLAYTHSVVLLATDFLPPRKPARKKARAA